MKGPPGRRGSTPACLTNVNGTLFFSADDGSAGRCGRVTGPRPVRCSSGTSGPSNPVVKNNQDYAVFYPSGDEFRDEVTDRVPVESGDFYYLRVLQEDHNMGWASPIWIDLSDSTNGRVPEVSSSCALWCNRLPRVQTNKESEDD